MGTKVINSIDTQAYNLIIAPTDLSTLKTTLSVDDKTAAVMQRLLGDTCTLHQSDNGVSNSVFFAKNAEGRTQAVIKIFTKDSTERVQRITSVTNALNAHNVPTPRVLGQFENLKHEPVLMMEYIQGSHIELPPERLKAIGQTMARLHTADIGKPALPEKSYTHEFFEELFKNCEGWDQLPKLREAYNKIDLSYLKDLRRSMVHGDFSQTNVITEASGKVHLIDFDHVHYDYSLTDLARAQLFFGFDKTTLKEETIKHMVAGYNEVTPLTEAEKKNFYKHLKLIIIWGLLDEHYHINIVKDLSGPRFEANQFNRSTSISYLLAKLDALADKEALD